MKLSIRYKVIIGYVLICIFSLGLLNIVLLKYIKTNNRNIISNELTALRQDTQDYAEKLYTSILVDSSMLQEEFWDSLRFSLNRYYNDYLIIYDAGYTKKLEFSPEINEDRLLGKSLDNIRENISSYDINYLEGRVIVDFPVKIKANGKDIGIVRYFIDYTNLIMMEKRVSTIVLYFSLVLGIMIVILSAINSNSIVKSILKFKDFVGNIGKDNFNGFLKVASQDEIGQLANNINIMKQRIANQMEEIRKDKEQIENISNFRKHFYENITHELKTPLTTIIGYTELAMHEKTYNEEYLKLINDESARMYNLVVSLLDMSYYGRSDEYRKIEKFNIDNLINEVCKSIEVKTKKQDVGLFIKENQALEFCGDKEGIKTVLVNLIDNSIKYNKEHGSIFVSSFVENEQWVLIVEDSGLGISDEGKLNLFKPFKRSLTSQTHNFDSSGLGLAIVKEIVDFHKGAIDVESTVNIGTKVTIKIPLQ